jgi:hypothetical protein
LWWDRWDWLDWRHGGAFVGLAKGATAYHDDDRDHRHDNDQYSSEQRDRELALRLRWLWKLQHLPVRDASLFLDEELLSSRCADVLALGPERQRDHVVVLGLLLFDDLKGHWQGSKPTVCPRLGACAPHCQNAGLIQRDISGGFTCLVEFERV